MAIILVTIGRIRSKKATEDKQKFRMIVLYFGLALFVLIVSIPWPFRETFGRGWF
jgi:lauroyl/myristoyl acyltransferase